jgi:methionyl-tRNA formyltransferase
VVTQPDRPRGRGQRVKDSPVKAAAIAHGLPVYQPARLREDDVVRTIEGWRPDLGVVAAYGKLIPEPLLDLPRLGMINVHASLLPRYRGAAPVHRAVIDGLTETGVTIMRVVPALDAGGMFARRTRPIGPDETSDAVEKGLAEIGAPLLLQVIEDLAAGTAVETPQDEARSTYAARLTKEEGLIDWSLPAASIHNRVRGLYPWPHAYTYLDGSRLIILETTVRPGAAGGDPGTLLGTARDAFEVATGDGRLAITALQAEGKRPMRVREYLAGHPLSPGARLTGP